MPYTFVEIEATRGRRIVLLFATLLVVYLAGAAFVGMFLFFPLVSLGVLAGARSFHAPHEAFAAVRPVLVVLGVAVGATLAHWFLSLRGMVRRTLDLIGVQRLDPMDAYHRQLGNVVSEVAVATGGRRIEAVAVPARWLNAFAVVDFRGRAVIGVSEGLLVRLDRDELEAVVGHEAAHLVAGDSLLSTVSCSMAAVWAGCLQALMPDRDDYAASEPSSRATGGSLPVLGVVALMRGLTYLLNAWLSREREYRADATAVRLTRNPLALAQALHAIASDSRHGFIAGGELAPLFIVGSSPGAAAGTLSGFTSTHPPVERRIEVLLGMAHAGAQALEEHTPRPAPPTDVAIGPPAPPQRWFAREGLIWRGPFVAAELVALPWFGPFTPVSQGDARLAAPAWEQPEINRLLKRIDVPPTSVGGCPACGGALREVAYEGVPLHKCAACSGRLVTRERFARILARGEQPPSPEVHALALQLVREHVGRRGPTAPVPVTQGPRRRCPACGAEMVPFAYQAILPHRVTIDRCDPCGLLWFDGKELEVIQDVLAIFGD